MIKYLLWGIIIWMTTITAVKELPLVVIVPSYNNARWYRKNLDSILSQENYNNYRVIYINDCSSDKTFELVSDYLAIHDKGKKVTVINNPERRGSLANIYNAVHSCKDDEIILLLDGDDQFAHNHVLSYINIIYLTQNVWLTYGQYKEWPSGNIGFNRPFSKETIERNSFRKTRDYLPISHLKTFYAWLFKNIKKEDLMYDGTFFQATGDKAFMAPMIEMAGYQHRCINDILYIYNNQNPINVHSVNKGLQMKMMRYILAKPPYQRLKNHKKEDTSKKRSPKKVPTEKELIEKIIKRRK